MPSDPTRPHVLYVCWGFPPSRGSGVYRGLATANTLADLDCDVTVLTADREMFIRSTGIDESLEKLVDPRIKIVRVKFEWPETERDISQWPLERAKDPAGWLANWNREAEATFPEARYGAWLPGIVEAADEIHRQSPIDLVVATANPNVDAAVGLHLYETAGVPYVYDQRDAWSLNVLTELIDHRQDTLPAKMEKRLIESSMESWFVNDAIRDWYRQTYPQASSKMHSVMNGYDPDFSPAPNLLPADPAEQLTVGYLGTITPQVPLAETLEGWVQARETDPLVASAKLEFYGNLGHFAKAGSNERRLLQGAAPYGVHYGGPAGKVNVRDVYAKFDVLVFLTGGGKYVTSGKVFEYMASGLPIVSCHVPELAAAALLVDYPLWFPTRDLSPESIADAFSQACAAAISADEETRRRCIEHAANYERSRQLREPLERVLAQAGCVVPK